MFDINTSQGYFLHLVRCALKNESPIEKPENVSFDEVYDIALKQNLLNLVWFSIEKLNNKPSDELCQDWFVKSSQLLSQMAYQELELELLIQALGDLGYTMLPLKGYQIKQYYPEPDMRTMGDIDLLLKTDGSQNARDKVKEIMLGLGYEIDILNDGQVDSYMKPNNVVMEIHFSFMAENHPHHYDFVVDWDRLVPTDNKSLYQMTLDDLYYFNIGHFIKNMSTKGNGIKPVLDAYVLWQNMTNEQKNIVNNRLENVGLKKISDLLLAVAKIWFDDENDDLSTANIQEYLMNNAVYGYEKNREILNLMKTQNDDLKSSVFKKYLKRFFPSAETLYSRFGIKHKIFVLLPFLWIARLVLLPFKTKEQKQKIKVEMEATRTVTAQDVAFFKSVYEKFGIDYKD